MKYVASWVLDNDDGDDDDVDDDDVVVVIADDGNIDVVIVDGDNDTTPLIPDVKVVLIASQYDNNTNKMNDVYISINSNSIIFTYSFLFNNINRIS